MNSLEELLEDQLKDIYSAEQQLTKARGEGPWAVQALLARAANRADRAL